MISEVVKEVRVYTCPMGHTVSGKPFNSARAKTGRVDCGERPIYEGGLWCHQCGSAYGFSRLIEPDFSSPD